MRLSPCRAVAVLLLAAAPLAAQTAPYHMSKQIVLGGEGGWDYLIADGVGRRLYVSHGTRVEVVDLTGDTAIGAILNTPGVHGIAFALSLGRGFTSNGRDSTVTIFDLGTLATIGTVNVGARNPDAIIYDPASRRVFTMNGGSGNATAIEAATGTVAGTVALNGRPEFAVSDGRGRVYVNLEDSHAADRPRGGRDRLRPGHRVRVRLVRRGQRADGGVPGRSRPLHGRGERAHPSRRADHGARSDDAPRLPQHGRVRPGAGAHAGAAAAAPERAAGLLPGARPGAVAPSCGSRRRPRSTRPGSGARWGCW